MKTKIFLFFHSLFIFSLSFSQQGNNLFKGNNTPTYSQLIQLYQKIDKENDYAQLIEFGVSDVGKPLHLLVLDKHRSFQPKSGIQKNKSVVLINNGIHPGESCGIDASMLLIKDLLDIKSQAHKLLDDLVILIIPVYNIGGMLNRGSYSRANQNGPESYGFRGNAKNLDLNRDFIKCDSKNSASFNKMFRNWQPEVYVETHTTNGSNHQYTLTLINSQKDKLPKALANFQEEIFIPKLYNKMEKRGMPMIPYVYPLNKDPKKGIKAFLETPRYSTGYAALHNCLGFITEAHVFKPYADRVNHTLGFLQILLQQSATYKNELKAAQKSAQEEQLNSKTLAVNWTLDSSQFKLLSFKGYERVEERSTVTQNRMYFYKENLPYEKEIKYFDTYQASVEVNKAEAYIIPQAYDKVINRLRWNGVKMKRLKNDSLIYLSYYRIKSFQSLPMPYEAHYLHYNTEVVIEQDSIQFYQGDFIIPVNQEATSYITHVLEPQSVDGFFSWNFFDGILQQKEWFSDFAFEPKAKKILQNEPDIKAKFEEAKANDSLLRKNNFEQLYFIYKLSPYYELTVNRYPVYRIEKKTTK